MHNTPPDYLPDQITAIEALKRQYALHAGNFQAVWLPLSDQVEAGEKARRTFQALQDHQQHLPPNHTFQ